MARAGDRACAVRRRRPDARSRKAASPRSRSSRFHNSNFAARTRSAAGTSTFAAPLAGPDVAELGRRIIIRGGGALAEAALSKRSGAASGAALQPSRSDGPSHSVA